MRPFERLRKGNITAQVMREWGRVYLWHHKLKNYCLRLHFFQFSQFYANLAIYKWLSACFASKKTQSSLNAPWAQVCNENRSRAIAQYPSQSAHKEPACRFQQHLLVGLYSPSISLLPNEAMQCWLGCGSEGGIDRSQEDDGRKQFVLRGTDNLNFRFAVKRSYILMRCCGHLSLSGSHDVGWGHTNLTDHQPA